MLLRVYLKSGVLGSGSIWPLTLGLWESRFCFCWGRRWMFIIKLGDSLEGVILKLKLQYFGHLMQRTDSLGKTLMLEEIEGRRRRGWQRMRWLDGITNLMDMSMGTQRVGHDWATELNWGTDVFCVYYFNQSFLQYTGLETIISTVLQRGYWITHINIK